MLAMLIPTITLALPTRGERGSLGLVPGLTHEHNVSAVANAITAGCRCVHPSYPCYGWRDTKGKSSCWGVTTREACAAITSADEPREFCVREACTVANCESCSASDGSVCEACASTHVMEEDGSCSPQDAFFSTVRTKFFHSKKGGGLIVMESSKLRSMLAAGYRSGDRASAVMKVAQAVLHSFKDAFDLVLVYPSSPLQGGHTYQQYWGASALGFQKLKGVVCGGNPKEGGYSVASMHEVSHHLVQPQQVLPLNPWGVHWGVVEFRDKKGSSPGGMLGGFETGAFTCVSPSGRKPSKELPCNGEQILVARASGSFQTSNDAANKAFPLVELYMMGILSEAELREAEPTLVYCPVASSRGGKPGAPTMESDDSYGATCVGGLQFLGVDDILSRWTPTGNEVHPGTSARVASVILYDDGDAPNTVDDDKYAAWMSSYYADKLQTTFQTAIVSSFAPLKEKYAPLQPYFSFVASAADRIGSAPAPSAPAPGPGPQPASAPAPIVPAPVPAPAPTPAATPSPVPRPSPVLAPAVPAPVPAPTPAAAPHSPVPRPSPVPPVPAPVPAPTPAAAPYSPVPRPSPVPAPAPTAPVTPVASPSAAPAQICEDVSSRTKLAAYSSGRKVRNGCWLLNFKKYRSDEGIAMSASCDEFYAIQLKGATTGDVITCYKKGNRCTGSQTGKAPCSPASHRRATI